MIGNMVMSTRIELFRRYLSPSLDPFFTVSFTIARRNNSLLQCEVHLNSDSPISMVLRVRRVPATSTLPIGSRSDAIVSKNN